MDDPFDRGLPFESGGLWRSSIFAHDLGPQDGLFQHPDLELPSLELNDAEDRLETEFDFSIPKLVTSDIVEVPALDNSGQSKDPAGHSVDFATEILDPHDHADIWDASGDTTPGKSVPRLYTWETFEGKDVHHAEHSAYLSEAGPLAFNAMLTSRGQNKDIEGVLPQDVSLKAFCNLALGRSSIFFQWHAAERHFEPTLYNTPVSGFSLECTDSMIEYFSTHGSDIRNLYEYVTGPDRRQETCPAVTALKRCVEGVLENMEATLSGNLSSVQTFLQLKNTLQASRELLNMLLPLSQAVKNATTDEQAISALADGVHVVVETGSIFARLARMILTRASQPWLDALTRDLGLADHSPSFVQMGASDTAEPEIRLDTSSDDSPYDTSHALSFLDAEDSRLIQETKASIRLLRRYFPDYFAETADPQHSAASTRAPSSPADIASNIWAIGDSQLETLDRPASIDPAVSGLGSFRDFEVQKALARAFAGDEVGSNAIAFEYQSGTSLSPMADLWPGIIGQAHRINSAVLQLFFERCQLRKHIEVQRSFNLFGSGYFLTRLATALFSSDTQSAERTRGVVPTSQTVGLRLGAKEGQRWPPASSELQLTLKDVLNDVYNKQYSFSSHTFCKSDLPGGLSFTIRELSDAEIDRVMDPTSIYALDFLKLQYIAPPPLDTVITPTAMWRYDDVFRFLLKLVRLQHVTTRMQSSVVDGAQHTHLIMGANHLTTTLMTHFMDIGIGAPWAVFETALDDLEKSTHSNDEITQTSAKTGLHYLRNMHENCLDIIRGRLFLKRKQQKIQSAIEDVFKDIMKAASKLQIGKEMSNEAMQFEVSATLLVKVIQEHVDRPPKIRASDPSPEAEIGATRLLLSRLNWNEFYSGNMR